MSKESENNKNLDTFSGWEQVSEDVNFFGEDTQIVTEVPVETKKEEEGKETPEKKKEEVVEDDSKFFGEVEDDEPLFDTEEKETVVNENTEEETETPKEEKEEIEEEEELVGSIGALTFLKEKGTIDYELEEGEELTEEKAAEILEDEWENSIESRVEELFEEMPKFVKDLNKFVLQGGDVRKFLSAMTKNSKVDTSVDLSIESNQELVVRQSLSEEGYDEDYIQTQIDFLKDSNKLENFSKNKIQKKKEREDREAEALKEEQRKLKEQQKVQQRKAKTKLASTVSNLEEIKGIKLSKVDKKELPNYMLERNVKLQNGGKITTMQKDIMEALQDENKAIFLAKLLRNDFDLSDLAKEVQTKVTKKVKDGIRRNKRSSKNIKSTDSAGSSAARKDLSDYF